MLRYELAVMILGAIQVDDIFWDSPFPVFSELHKQNQISNKNSQRKFNAETRKRDRKQSRRKRCYWNTQAEERRISNWFHENMLMISLEFISCSPSYRLVSLLFLVMEKRKAAACLKVGRKPFPAASTYQSFCVTYITQLLITEALHVRGQ